jgi:N-acetylglutamate synthase-like GNAT family acetyltransferase
MEIRQATLQDIPEIVELLKSSLGEKLMPKSESFFIWKHFKNPFGESKILIAEQDSKIIGVRAFMYWNWVNSEEEVIAVRAVDTATDPLHQGKGIFSKLTMKAVQECQQEGVSFVFNSPNPISLIGYLKMGWYIVGKMPLYIGLASLFPRFFSDSKNEKLLTKFNIDNELSKLKDDFKLKLDTINFTTPITKKFLNWRYRDCPVAKYGGVIVEGKFGIIFRLKKTNRFIELRICELWIENPAGDLELQIALNKIKKAIRPFVITIAKCKLVQTTKRNIFDFWGPLKIGPNITLRKLDKENLTNFNEFYHWQPSIGSMEIF